MSKIVSTINTSAPPSINARACSRYVETSSSKLTLRKPGSLTSGEIDAVLVVGPSAPATHLGLSGVFLVNSSATDRAIFAASRLSS